MLKQDFSKRITIIVNKNLEEWQVLNTVAHISAYIGKILSNKFDNEIEYLGIGVFGENNQINSLTKEFILWK